MNHHSAFDRAYDDAQRLARRHERDLHWAKERRRQQEREVAEAEALLASSPWSLARRTVVVSAILFALIAAGAALATGGTLPPGWLLLADAVVIALAVTVAICTVVSLFGIRSRRVAARAVLRSRDERLAHTQYHIHESVHSFVDSRSEVFDARPAHVA